MVLWYVSAIWRACAGVTVVVGHPVEEADAEDAVVRAAAALFSRIGVRVLWPQSRHVITLVVPFDPFILGGVGILRPVSLTPSGLPSLRLAVLDEELLRSLDIG